MSDETITIKMAVPDGLTTDSKVGYVLKFRVVKSDITTDARLLALYRGQIPVTIRLDPAEDLLSVDPAIDYADVDAVFDENEEEDEH